MNDEQPLVSVVTVCLNSEKTIARTIESVLAQTYHHYEYLIVDGKSTDGTLAIIDKYRERFDGRLSVVSEKDTGIYSAINKGILLTRGEIIGIVNSDDCYAPHALERVAEIYAREKYPLLVVNGDMVRVSGEGEEICRYHFTIDDVKRKRCFGHPAMFAARAVYDRIGRYDESYRFAADGEWQFRAHEDEAVRYLLYPEVFTYMREGGASDDLRHVSKWFRERSRMCIAHHRGSAAKIYGTELISAMRTFAKAILPRRANRAVYRFIHRKGL